jgi:signal transduction histidine kinase
MIGTFNALLDIARAEAGSERAAFETVPLQSLVADLIDLYEPLAEEHGLTLEHRAPSQLAMHANRHLLTQALANLLDNAIKYTPAGGRILLAVEPGPVITISDNGPGIPEAEREHVLERFVRLEQHRGTPGNGLGLSLVQAVAKLHGGRMTLADNRPGLKVILDFGPKRQRRAA